MIYVNVSKLFFIFLFLRLQIYHKHWLSLIFPVLQAVGSDGTLSAKEKAGLRAVSLNLIWKTEFGGKLQDVLGH